MFKLISLYVNALAIQFLLNSKLNFLIKNYNNKWNKFQIQLWNRSKQDYKIAAGKFYKVSKLNFSVIESLVY